MLGKDRRKKVRKTFLYILTNIVTIKWGEKRANNFSRKTIIMRSKNVGKKSSEKSAKNVFLYSQEYREQTIWGKKTRETIFPETHKWCDQKMLGKNHRKYV